MSRGRWRATGRGLAVVGLATLGLLYPDRNLSHHVVDASGTGTVTAPAAPTFSLSTAGQDPGDFVLSGFASDATLLVSIGFVDPPASTTFALPTTTGLTAGSGYDFTGNKTQISFTGSQTNANAALAAMTVSTGATNGTVTIRVTASVNASNVYYNPINDHFYEYVSSPANVYAWRAGADKSLSAFHLAEQRTLNGMTGYLATVTNAQEQRFIYNNFPNTNIWLGGTDDWQVINARCSPSVTNKVLTGNVATLTTSTQHAIEVSDSVTIAGVDATFNGTFTVTAATSTTFSYTKTAGDVASSAVGSGASATFADQTSAEGSWMWVSGPTDEKCTRFTQGATGSQKWINASSGRTQDRQTANVSSSRYENWCNGNGGAGDTAYSLIERNNYGEPNGTGTLSSNGEQFLLEKWGGSSCWNDWGRIDDGQNTGFLVEYGGAGSTSTAPTATVSAIVDNAPKNVMASRATPVVSGSLDVSWTAPSTGTVTSYTATSTPGSRTCTSSTTSCTVTGLTNGTAYTFTVTATFNDSTTKTSTASAAATPDDGTTPTVAVTTARIRAAASATVRSTKTGTAYLVKDTVTVTNKASITGAADSQWNQVSIAAVDTDTSLAATGLVDGTYKAYAVDAIDNLSAVSTGTVTVDSTAPTAVTLAASSTTSSSATITFTVTGSEDLDCTTLSTTSGVDFTLAGMSAISSIAQTSGSVCTITATSTATAGGTAVTSTLTAVALTFSVSDTAGNEQTTLSGSPQSITVTVPQNDPAVIRENERREAERRDHEAAERCARANHAFDDCPLWSGNTTTTTVAPATTTSTTTTSIALQPLLPIPTTTAPTPVTTARATTTTVRRATTTSSSEPLRPLLPIVTPPSSGTPTTTSSIPRPVTTIASATTTTASVTTTTAPVTTTSVVTTATTIVIPLASPPSIPSAPVRDVTTEEVTRALEASTSNVNDLSLPVYVNSALPNPNGPAPIIVQVGSPERVDMVTINEQVIQMSTPDGFRLAVSAVDEGGAPTAVSPSGAIVVEQDHFISVSGSGFRPGSEAVAWLFSTPRRLGVVSVAADGSFSASLPIGDIAIGDHTTQVNGYTANGALRSLNLAVEVVAPGSAPRAVAASTSVGSRVVEARWTAYDPTKDADTTNAITAALAAFVALAGATGLAGARLGDGDRRASRAKLSSITTKKLKAVAVSDVRWGDASRTWRSPFTARADEWSRRAPLVVGRISAVLPRLAVDGTWARAVAGANGYALWLVGAAMGLAAGITRATEVPMPAWSWVVAISVLGIADGAAGAVAWLAFTAHAGASADVAGWYDVRLLMGLGVLWCSLPLLAHVIRPLRRVVTGDGSAIFERLCDYAMPPIFVAFAAGSMAKALNGLSGLALVEAGHVTSLRWTVALVLPLRVLLEDVASHLYPQRSLVVQPAKLVAPSKGMASLGVATSAAVFLFVAEPFFGLNASTIAAAALVALPSVMKQWEDDYPNSTALNKWLPRGLLRFFLLLVLGAYMSSRLIGPEGGDDAVRRTLVVMLVPSSVVGVIELFGRSGGSWRDGAVKRVGGALVWATAIGIVTGAITLFG